MRSLILSFSFIITATFFVVAQSENCTTATMLGAADLTDGVATSGATTADNTASGFWGGIAPQMDLTCDATNTYTIDEWWRFDVVSGNDITIDMSSATNQMVAILEATTANCGTPNLNTFLGCMDPSMGNPVTFENCFMAGNTYYIVVLTDAANQGPYDLTVTEGGGTSSSALGDNCSNAISLNPVADGTDGTTITCGADNVSGTSLNNFQEAKGTNSPQSPCIESDEATVWYSFTAGDDVYIENTSSVDLSVALYSGVCGALSLIDCDATGNIQEVDALIPGAIYYIQVAYPYGFDGTFDICLNSPLVPTPDDCATPEVLSLVDGATTNAVQMDNFGATSTGESFTPTLIGTCGAGSFSTIYYQFTIGGVGNTHVNINYDEAGASPITNSQITILLNCGAATAFNGYEWAGSTDENICLMPGTYYIQIASCDADEGNYTLALTPNTPPSNDECAAAELFNDPVTASPVTIVPPICEVYNVVGTTVNACPEASNLGSTCAFGTESTVWYTFTTNATPSQEAEITLNPSGGTPIVNGTFALLQGPCDGTLVGTCQTDLNEANITLTPNTQYYIVVSQQAIGGVTGTFDLDLEITSTPTNDDCNLATNPVIMNGTAGTTICADGEINYCGMPTTADHQVFYQYTNLTGGNVDLTITFNPDGTNGLAATDISMIVLEDNCTTFTVFNGTSAADYCNILSSPQNIDCIENGETIIIAVGSPDDGSQGEFTVTLAENTTQPTDDNDECTDALNVFDPAIDNTCEWITVNGTTVEACPEDFTIVGCDYDIDPVVWYSFIAPTSANPLTVELQNLVGAGVLYATIFEMTADCDIQTVLTGANCDSGTGPFGPYDIVSGTTYLIGVGDDTEGPHSFDIKVNELPANDECIDAVVLTPNTSTPGTTICATQEAISYNSAVCTNADETNTVWYEVTVGPGEKGFNLTVSAGGAIPIMGDINAVLFETTSAGCIVDASTFVDEDCLTLGMLTEQFECVGEGTYIIRISSSDSNAGEFNILFEPLLAIMFDVCSDPDAATFNPVIDCEWMPGTAVTIDACPEAFDFPNNCGFDDFPVIWYEVTAPINATQLDLMTVSSTNGSPFIAVLEGLPADCDNITSANAVIGSNCYSGIFPDLDTEGSGPIDVVGGNTYFIGIGSDDINGSTIEFEIKFITPPLNDECVDGVVLTSGVSQMGTTTCATQAVFPYDSGVCSDPDEENTVWYEFTVPDGVNGFDITVTATAIGGFSGDLNIVVFESTAIGCVADASTFEDEVCTTSAILVEDFECIGPGTYVIRISTSEANEGDFDILVTEYISPVVNDLCSNPTIINVEPVCEWYPVDANTIDACPEQFDFASNCGFDDFPVVWYEINVTDDDATEIQINLISSATGNAFYSVFNGNPIDCEDLTPASVSGFCETTLGQNTVEIDIEANGPQTYLIGIGADAVGGSSSIQFEIKVIVPPMNDDPCDAEVIATAGDVNTTVMGTTECASMDVDDFVCDLQDENSVWYEYTIPAGTTGFIVTLTESGDGQDFAVGVYDFPNGCLNNPIFLDPDVQTDCALEDGGELEFKCLDENTTAWIMVSTLDNEAGEFELTIDPIVPDPLCIDNDLCDMADNASPISTPITDGGQVCVSDCNLEACPWEFNAGDCLFGDFPTVFYTVTTDANAEDATMTVILSSADGNPFFSIIEFNCAAPTAVTAESFCVEGDGAAANLSNMEVDANTTYIIVVALDEIDEEGGDFELCVNVTTSCNDDPCSPYPLVQGDGVNGIALDCDNNIGSTSEPFDYVSPDCDDPLLFASTVYFSYTVPDNISSFTLFYTNDPVNGILNTVGINIMVYDAANCAFQQVEVVDQQCIQPGNVEPMEIDCPVSGDTYLIQITSAAGDEGEFDIEITETIQDDPCAANDDCDFAMVLDVSETCEWLEFPDCNIQACPEEFVDPGMMCAYDASAVVWYTFTTPANAVTAHIDLVPGSVTDPTWGLFIDNGCAVPPTAVTGDVVCVTVGGGGTALEEDIPIDENTTYYIAVGSESNIEGDFTLNIKIDVPPINDDPCIDADNPPLDLTGGGSHTGTTCCARGPKDENPDGSLADYENVDCSAATEDAAVWYMYTPSPDDDGYSIILESGGVDPSEGPIAIEVYSGAADQGCNGGFGQTLASSCADFGVSFSIGNCLAPGEVLFIKVSTDDADENCGEFILTIVPASCGPMADDCIDLADETPIEPVTNPSFSIDYTCITGCLDYACPEDQSYGGCPDFTQMPTVWFQVTADDIAAQMFTTVEPMGNWEPIWSVFSGPDCDNLEVVNFGGAPPCSNGDNTPELHQTSVFDDEENYWIAVTIDPNSLPPSGLDDGSFELCVATTINAIICLGELEGGACDDESLVMEITDREIEDQPLEGPFCQGEEVTINISFFYDASESGADWLIGFVPIFGPGWDLENFDYVANAPVGNGQTAEWYEDDGDCAPLIQEPNPILCTYTDADGNLQLCNLLCSPCSECPTTGMVEGDPLPSGYFWVSNGGNPGCDNDCSPGEGWGIGSITAQIDWTFTLMVKEFESYEDCIENNDLSISFQTFSDGTAGCWEDPVGECFLDRAMFSPAWEIECEAPSAVEGPDQELCHDGITDIFVQTVDGSTNTIIVEVEDNPNVSGEMNHTFPGGTGTIQDDLTNLTNGIQIVIYNVFSEDLTLPCPGVINQIEVTIYPELMATFPPTYVCEGECIDISPDVVGGIGVPYEYSWSTGESTPSINVCPVVPTTYFVTVEDALGCMDIAEVQVDVAPPVELLLPESISVCKDDNYDPFNPDYFVCLEFLSGTPPYTVMWNAPPGLVLGNPYGVFGEKVPINEQTSSEFAGNNGEYILSVTVTDAFGCMAQTDMLVIITGDLTLFLDTDDVACGETDVVITATGIDAVGNPVTNFILYGGCPDDDLGDFLEDAFSSSGTVSFPTQSLLDYTCYTVVAQTESGCQTTQDITIPFTEGTPIEITGTPEVCIGEEATITITNASEFTDFVWTPNIGNTGTVSFTPDSTATYLVEATDISGCNSQEVYEVVVNPLPTIALAGTTTFCAGGSATVSASGGTTYTWTDGGSGATGNTYTTSMEGNVTLVLQDANGCESDTTITFTEEDQITVNIGGPNLCDGMEDTLFITGVFDSYSWTFNAMEVGTDSFLVVTEPGTYNVNVDAGGCPGTGQITIQNFDTPVIMVSDTVEVCRLDSGIDSLCVNFNNQVTGSPGVWTQQGIIPGFTFNPMNLDSVCFEGIQTGCYSFRYTTNGAQAPCMNVFETMVVCVKACPCPSPATQPINPICNTGTTNLENAELTTDPGTWSVESGPMGQDITGILNGTIFNANGIMGGDYVVQFTLDNPGGAACLDSSVQTITVFEAPNITAVDGFMCNVDNGTDPIVLDLYDLLTNADASDGGSWQQTGGAMVNITGADMSTIMSSDLSSFPETLTFEYTSGVEAGSPCPPDVVEVEVVVRDCNCPFLLVMPDTLCNNGMAIDLNDLLVNPEGLSGTWSTTGNLVGMSMFDPGGLPSGQYTITFTLDSSPGPNCDLTYSNTILVRRQSVAVPSTSAPPCSADTGNGPTTTNLYNWLQSGYSTGTWAQTGGSPTLSFTDNGLNMAVVDFVGQPPGSMFVFTFTTNSALVPCTNISVEVTITVVDCNCPPIVLDPAPDLCNDAGTIDLCDLTDGSDPGSYSVASIGGTDISNRITGCIFDGVGLNPGDYVITFTLDEAVSGICEQFLRDTFRVEQYLSTTIMDPPEVCNDPNGNGLMSLNFTTLVGNAGVGIWEDTDGSGVAIATLPEQQDVSFLGVAPGSYTFTYRIDNEEPCEDVVLTMVVNVTDDCNCPSINPLTPLDECNTDGPIDLTQYDDPIRPGSWSSTELTVDNGNSLIIDGVASGTYILTYTIIDSVPDCPTTMEVMILIGEPANAGTPAVPYRLCEGESEVVSLSDLLEGSDAGGTWTETSSTLSSGFNASDASLTTDAEVAGTYTFAYTISENDPCPPVSATVTVIIEANPVADAGAEKFIDCINTTAILGGPNTTTGTEITYSWVNTTTGAEVGTTETIEVTNEGTYELTVLNTTTGCSDRSTTQVMKSDDLPTMLVTPSDISCFGFDDGGIILSDQSGGDGNYTYSLNGGAATTDANAFSTLPAGDYEIEIIDGIGCTQSYMFTIEEPAALTVEAGPAIVVGEVGESFELSIEPFDTSTVVSIVWSNSETTEVICSGLNCTTITVNPIETTSNYYVEVTNANGCTAFDEVQIQLQQIVDVIFPNIITPNGDNINDDFYIKSKDVETVISMKIFDRWGEKLFDLGNFPPRDPEFGWDGKFKGKKVVPGVYVFTVEVLFVNGETRTISGDVTVTDSE